MLVYHVMSIRSENIITYVYDLVLVSYDVIEWMTRVLRVMCDDSCKTFNALQAALVGMSSFRSFYDLDHWELCPTSCINADALASHCSDGSPITCDHASVVI